MHSACQSTSITEGGVLLRMSATSPRLIVLTGATRGLGRAMTEGFAANGHRVLGCGTSPDGIARMKQLLGPPHDFATIDVTNGEQVKAWAARLLARHGPPDLLLNN